MRRAIFLLLCFLLAPSLFGQDLNRLRTRAEEHWKLRVKGDKTKAVQYVDSKSRDRFLELFDPFLKSATITSFEFLKDPKDVLVRTHLLIGLPIGDVTKDLSELWSWRDGNWLLRLEGPSTSDLFDQPVKVFPGPPRVEFEISATTLDLGKHVQGDLVSGVVPFKGRKAEIFAIGVEGVPNLNVKEVRWKDESGGEIEFTLDTSLLIRDLSQNARFLAVGAAGVRTPSKDVNVRLAMEGRVQFVQVPEMIDVRVPGQVQIEIRNLTDRPLAVASARGSQADFLVKDADQVVPPKNLLEIAPRAAGRLTIEYPPQINPAEVEVLVQFVGNIFAKPVAVPLSILLPKPEEPPALVDPALLEQILRRSRGGFPN